MDALKKVFEETVKCKFDELKADSQTYGEIKMKIFKLLVSAESQIEKEVFYEVKVMAETEMESKPIER